VTESSKKRLLAHTPNMHCGFLAQFCLKPDPFMSRRRSCRRMTQTRLLQFYTLSNIDGVPSSQYSPPLAPNSHPSATFTSTPTQTSRQVVLAPMQRPKTERGAHFHAHQVTFTGRTMADLKGVTREECIREEVERVAACEPHVSLMLALRNQGVYTQCLGRWA
jgi:hypothetical protein